MIYIGIDPGKKGSFSVLWEGKAFTYPWDDHAFIAQVDAVSQHGDETVACVEKVGAMPKQGVKSMFTFGKAAGFIEGVLSAYGISYQLVPPQTWKKEFGLNGDKAKSVEVCRKLFPGVSLLATERCRVPHDGMAEALLMAEYARRKWGR